jgi:A/G-specific adenine glycosylase
MELFPTVHDLAAAEQDEVMRAWAGLGYYSRARNLQAAARMVVDEWGGEFPRTASELLALPGVGPYTAAAVASICFGEPVAAVDGNVQRVVSRLMGIDEPVDRPIGRAAIAQGAEALLDRSDPGRHNQAVMELGALICTPRVPRCTECPVLNSCRSGGVGEAGLVERRPAKAGKTKVVDVSMVFHIIFRAGEVIMERRPASGIWGGLWCFPTTETTGAPREGLRSEGKWGGPVVHLLSHRRITAEFHAWSTEKEVACPTDWHWTSLERAAELGMPKVVERNWANVEKMLVNAFAKMED